jgi:hypothetical protein
MGMGTEDIRYISAIITAMSEQAQWSGSILRTGPEAGHSPVRGVRASLLLQREAGRKQFSTAASSGVHGRGQAPDIEVMEKDLLPERVQVFMFIPATPGWNERRATADT